MTNIPTLVVDAPPVTVRPARDSLASHTMYTAACQTCGNWQIVQIGQRPQVTGTSHYCPTAADGQPALVIWK